jgi:hypothetical protein
VTARANEYRAKARQCEELAEQTRDSYIKEQFLKTAQDWWKLAAYEEQSRFGLPNKSPKGES